MNKNLKSIVYKSIIYRVLSIILNTLIVYLCTKDWGSSLKISLSVETCKFFFYGFYEYIYYKFRGVNRAK